MNPLKLPTKAGVIHAVRVLFIKRSSWLDRSIRILKALKGSR